MTNTLDHVLNAFLARLRSWPSFYPPPTAQPVVAADRGPAGTRYRVEPTEWGVDDPVAAPAATDNPVIPQQSLATSCQRSHLPGADRLPTPRGLLTCSPASCPRPGGH